jgi:hypothetical protein
MSAETEKLFRRLLKELRPLFGKSGFRASSQNFIMESAECWVIVNFQKSRWADANETIFYVNVAASTKRWLGFYGLPPNKMPPHYGCDWTWRAEQLGPDKDIKHWTLRDEESLQKTSAYLQFLFQSFVLPATSTMTTEVDLMKHTGGFEYPQLKTRSVILAATNQVSDLRQTVAALLEKFGSGAVAQGVRNHLQVLRQSYPDAMHSIEMKERSL